MEEFMTSDEVAAVFRVLPRTVTEWHRTGKLVGKKIGRRLLFGRSAVEAFQRQGEAS